MCVEIEETNETRHLVDYSDARIEETLESLPEGSSIPLEMRPAGTRANVWEVVGLQSGRSAGSTSIASLD